MEVNFIGKTDVIRNKNILLLLILNFKAHITRDIFAHNIAIKRYRDI
jgi:hypothetical protein